MRRPRSRPGPGSPCSRWRTPTRAWIFGILIASRDSATVGGAVATNAGGVRVLRFGPMRAQLRGIEAVLADGTVVSHLAGLVKDNTGYDYPSLLAGSEGTLAVITAARLRLVPRLRDTVTALAGIGGLDEVHALARRAVREVPGLVSAEFFTRTGLDILVAHAGLAPPLAGAGGGVSAARGVRAGGVRRPGGRDRGPGGRRRGVRGRPRPALVLPGTPPGGGRVPRRPGQARRLGTRRAVGAARLLRWRPWLRTWIPGARVITFGHVADGNVHVNIVPAAPADGRHEDAVFSFVASLGGSISAEHGIGALKAPWLAAGAHRRGTGAVRQDPFGVRSVRHAEPERSPALIRRPGRSPAAGTGDRQGSR